VVLADYRQQPLVVVEEEEPVILVAAVAHNQALLAVVAVVAVAQAILTRVQLALRILPVAVRPQETRVTPPETGLEMAAAAEQPAPKVLSALTVSWLFLTDLVQQRLLNLLIGRNLILRPVRLIALTLAVEHVAAGARLQPITYLPHELISRWSLIMVFFTLLAALMPVVHVKIQSILPNSAPTVNLGCGVRRTPIRLTGFTGILTPRSVR
jgi:hypothetical protein